MKLEKISREKVNKKSKIMLILYFCNYSPKNIKKNQNFLLHKIGFIVYNENVAVKNGGCLNASVKESGDVAKRP